MKQSRKIFIFTYHTCFWLFRCAWSVRRPTSTDVSAVWRLSALLELGRILSTLWTGLPTLWTGWTITPPVNIVMLQRKGCQRLHVGNYQEHVSAWERQAWLRQAERLFSARGQWLDQFWGEDHQHQVSSGRYSIFFSQTRTNIRQVEDQDDHLMCQTLCADTAHCIGYTFVKVTLNVGGLAVGLFIVVAVVRMAEVAQKQKGPSPKSFDLDENFKC